MSILQSGKEIRESFNYCCKYNRKFQEDEVILQLTRRTLVCVTIQALGEPPEKQKQHAIMSII